uniref:Uncharacterized protein n=1 Tax=Eptatretus burgeri TaxID=7764 RepID=A0A8C4NMN9_EPTBU
MWLPVVTKKENQTHEEFAKTVQKLLGSALDLVPTPYSSADKAELIKRLAHEEHPPSADSRGDTFLTPTITPPSLIRYLKLHNKSLLCICCQVQSSRLNAKVRMEK